MKIKQSKEASDYQSDIYEAKVKIAEIRWESGYTPREHPGAKETSTDKQ
jgi:hypothetical protein